MSACGLRESISFVSTLAVIGALLLLSQWKYSITDDLPNLPMHPPKPEPSVDNIVDMALSRCERAVGLLLTRVAPRHGTGSKLGLHSDPLPVI